MGDLLRVDGYGWVTVDCDVRECAWVGVRGVCVITSLFPSGYRRCAASASRDIAGLRVLIGCRSRRWRVIQR